MTFTKHVTIGKNSVQFDCNNGCDATLALRKKRGLKLRNGAAPRGSTLKSIKTQGMKITTFGHESAKLNSSGYVSFEQQGADGGWHCYEFQNSDFEYASGANQFINAMANEYGWTMHNKSCPEYSGNGSYVWNSGFTEPRAWLAGTQWAGSVEYEYNWSAN